MDIRQTPYYADYLSKLGWKVERISDVNYFIRRFPIIGSLMKIQRPERINFNTIDRLSQKHGVFQTIIEPKNRKQEAGSRKHGYKLSKSPYLPSKTLVLDLKQSKHKILAKMRKETRRAIKRGPHYTDASRGREEPHIREVVDLPKFRHFWKKSVGFTRHVPSIKQLSVMRTSFPLHSVVFLASHNINAEIISGAMFSRVSKGPAYYWQGFSSSEGRSSLSQASLLYQGILWAKKHGSTSFDFEGIYDDRFPNESWKGFTLFKKGFGGIEKTYPGAYAKNTFFQKKWPGGQTPRL